MKTAYTMHFPFFNPPGSYVCDDSSGDRPLNGLRHTASVMSHTDFREASLEETGAALLPSQSVWLTAHPGRL